MRSLFQPMDQGCKFSDFILTSDFFTSTSLKYIFESSPEHFSHDFIIDPEVFFVSF